MDFLLTDLQLDPDVPVSAGWTAANIAAWAEHHEVLALLNAQSRGEGIVAAAWQSMTNFMGVMWLGAAKTPDLATFYLLTRKGFKL